MIYAEKISELGFFCKLPSAVRAELEALSLSRPALVRGLSELRLRAEGLSAVTVFGERIPLSAHVGRGELSHLVSELCDGSLYAYKDTIADGYIPLRGGVRVGVCGLARYDGGSLVGISEVSSLLFRIPTAASSFATELYELFSETERGLLICSPPACGKTTALRSLAAALARGRSGLNVAVVDERCEFIPDDYAASSVDIFRGYKKSEGLELALRTLSPDVMLVDEIGGTEEAVALLPYLASGVRIVATAHAASFSELSRKHNVAPFLSRHLFDSFAFLSRRDGEYHCEVRRLNA